MQLRDFFSGFPNQKTTKHLYLKVAEDFIHGFHEIVEEIKSFLNPCLKAIKKGNVNDLLWLPRKGWIKNNLSGK